jgi:glycosyltransferase involved in cell wall biosynthesis
MSSLTPAEDNLTDAPGRSSVCVVIPVYNGEPFLREAIASALSQDYPNLRVMVMDNASTDGTRKILEEVSDERFRACFFKEHVPVADSWGRALSRAQGDLVLLLSADNTLEPGAISKLVAALEAAPSCGFAYGRSNILVEVAQPHPFIRTLRRPRLGFVRDVEAAILKDGFTITMDGALFRRDLPELFTRPEAQNACDLDLFLRLGRAGVSGFGIADVVLSRREHDGALSSDLAAVWTSALEALEHHRLSTARPRLYRRRMWRVAFWAVANALARGQRQEARTYVQRFGNTFTVHQKLLLRMLLTLPGMPWLVLTVRPLWLRGGDTARGDA